MVVKVEFFESIRSELHFDSEGRLHRTGGYPAVRYSDGDRLIIVEYWKNGVRQSHWHEKIVDKNGQLCYNFDSKFGE